MQTILFKQNLESKQTKNRTNISEGSSKIFTDVRQWAAQDFVRA